MIFLNLFISSFIPHSECFTAQNFISSYKPISPIIGHGRKELAAIVDRPTALFSTTISAEKETDNNAKTAITEEALETNAIRPLHQNWWPVTTLDALDSSRPNAIELLGMDLVLFKSNEGDDDDNNHGWTCFDDRCSHRFAPLSEGRVIDGTNDKGKKYLQCAYHGWEFDDNGSCQHIPQLENGKQIQSSCNVPSYPVRIDAGMLFVWADPSTANLGQLIPLPTFPTLREKVEKLGQTICYMRDLPYGYEFLCENLTDLAHLPFSHHGISALERDISRPLRFKMLSSAQKSEDNPLFEAILEDAASTDPIFLGNPAIPADADASLNIGFYQPSHIRWTRDVKGGTQSSIVIYLCPKSASESRVLIFNLYERGNQEGKSSMFQKFKARGQKALINRIFTPDVLHRILHKLFDGDGIFLRMQGDRMQKNDLSYTDYQSPTSSDLLTNAYRRYLKTACDLTRKEGKEDIAEAAWSKKGYGEKRTREKLLDRYESHTKNCSVCSAALATKQAKKKKFEVARSIFNGGIGASSSAILALLLLSTSSEVSVPTALVRITSKLLVGSVISSFGIAKLSERNDKAIKEYIFEDYVHAEKD